jgi:guanine deaminase
VTSKLVSMLPKGHGAREQDGVKGKGKEGNGNGSTEKEEDDSPVLAPLVTAPSAHASSPGVDPKTGPLFGTFGSLVQLPMATLFFLGTQGGADVCGLGQTIGSLETGKEYDALLVDVRNYRGAVGVWWDDDEHGEEREGEGDGEGWRWRDEEDLRGAFEKWVWAGDDRNLARVWVRGREVGGKDWVNEREKA